MQVRYVRRRVCVRAAHRRGERLCRWNLGWSPRRPSANRRGPCGGPWPDRNGSATRHGSARTSRAESPIEAATRCGVVVGDGSDDRRLDERVAPTPPAWKPGRRHLLAYADRGGHVRLVNADTDRRLWASGAFTTRIESLAWSADGRRLLVLTRSFFVMLDGRGNAIAKGATGG